MKTRIGCLGLLALWALFGAYIHFTRGFGEEGGGKFALIGLMGLVVVLVGSAIEWLTTSGRKSNDRRPPPRGEG